MKTAGKLFPILRYSVSLLLVLILGCAKSIAPPGGPVDRTPPEIIASTPASGSIGISVDSSIVIEFSEAIDAKSVEKALFVTPLQDEPPKVKVKGKLVQISFPAGLEKNRTYVITLGTDLRDAHNVALDQSLNIAFSTGQTIDAGVITGIIFEKTKGKNGVSLALFSTDPASFGLPVDSLTPEYLTQSGEDGKYKFEYLPAGKYYPVAFNDANKNRRIEPKREMIGLPFTEVIIDSNHPVLSGVDVKLHKTEAKFLGFRSVSISPDLLLKVRFNRQLRKYEAEVLFNEGEIRGDSTESIKILDYYSSTEYPSSDFFILTDNLRIGQEYTLSFYARTLFPDLPDSLHRLLYNFTAIDIKDLNPPQLENSYPGNQDLNISPDSIFRLDFSEPVDSAAITDALRIFDSTENIVSITTYPENSFSYRVRPVGLLEYGHWYSMEIDNRKVIDRAGNVMGDSITSLSFTTVGKDTLGQLSGEVQFSDPNDAAYPVLVSFQETPRGMPLQITIPPAQPEFIANLLPGYYSISAFLDRNQNGLFDYGSIIPYELAEPFAAPADTMRVRTRFETTGVIIQF